jgi:hypothetical protein
MAAFEKEWFPELRKSKLMSRAASPLKILPKINVSAYKLELPPEFGVNPTFNILDLWPYLGEEDEMPSRITSMQEGEDDEDINTWPYHRIMSTTIKSSGKLALMLFRL